MRIAFLGTRGIPAAYGGFETCVHELSLRLRERGHEVTVYCRSDCPSEAPKAFQGVTLIQMARLRRSFLESPFNSFVATIAAATSDADIVHYLGCGNVPFTLLARLSGKKVVLTVDGIEWKRTSYSRAARAYLRSFAELAMVFPNKTVADSDSSRKWYYDRTGVAPLQIPYGTKRSTEVDMSILEKYGLERGEYTFFSGRLVHEKGVHTLVKAFKSITSHGKLVIVGDFPGHSEYVNDLRREAGPDTVFLGAVYGRGFDTLRNASRVFVHPSMLEGTSISLLGALGAGCCVISSDLVENIEVAGDAAIYFKTGDAEDLKKRLLELFQNPSLIEEGRRKSVARALELFDWDKIVLQYEEIYEGLLRR